MSFRNQALVFPLLGILALASCSHQLTLRNTGVAAKPRARMPEKSARFFIDRIEVPHLIKKRIGKKRNFAGDYLAWVYTDDDLALWSRREWIAFLKRHGHSVVPEPEQSDYTVECDVLYLWTEKKWDAKWDDDFAAHIELKTKIIDRSSGSVVFKKRWKAHYNTQRPYEQNDVISDEQMFNKCLCTVFQRALEQITLSPGASQP